MNKCALAENLADPLQGAGGNSMVLGVIRNRLYDHWRLQTADETGAVGRAGDDVHTTGFLIWWIVHQIRFSQGTESDDHFHGSDLLDDAIYGADGNDWLEGYGGSDKLNGENGDDLLEGGVDDDYLYGGPGGDRLEGGAGEDWLEGGDGDDILMGGAGGDWLNGGDASWPHRGVDTASYAGSARGVTIDLVTGQGRGGDAEGDTLISIESVIGSDGDDVFVANWDVNWLAGGAGIDRADYDGSTGGVTVDLGTGQCSGGWAEGDELFWIEEVVGSAYGDRITGNGAANRLWGGDGGDALSGGGGDDKLYGEDGDDVITGGDGQDWISGGAGDDRIEGGSGFGILDGDDGADVITGGGDIDQISGGAGDDVVSGDGHDDALYGDAGADRLEGGEGRDRLNGGAGADVLTGGAGEDNFYY
ncbi:hypothetical protein KXS07_36920, partial [Inquilinus limosus]|uniref:calcium-binding protein n=1 Tax=Inquilinus limosus TaxID=171674 RepID=UPI003F16CF3E